MEKQMEMKLKLGACRGVEASKQTNVGKTYTVDIRAPCRHFLVYLDP